MGRHYATWAGPLLAPLFFVLFEWHRQYGPVDGLDVLCGWVILAAAALIIAIGTRLALRRRADVAAAVSIVAILLFCFWGYFYERLVDIMAPATPPRPLILMAIWLPIAGGILWLFARLRQGLRVRWLRFSVLLFGTLSVYEGGLIARKAAMARHDFAALPPAVPSAASSWNFYLLLFDELASPESLREMGYDPAGIESFLRESGFNVLQEPRSNYDHTVFSMSSMLNGAYVPGRRSNQPVSAQDYSDCLRWIDEARLPKAFKDAGYAVTNYSIFDLLGSPPLVGKPHFHSGLTLLFGSTFFGQVVQRKIEEARTAESMQRDTYYSPLFNQYAILKELSRISADGRRFVYAHFMTPHRPFVFDTTGQLLEKEASYTISYNNDRRYYIPAVRHTEDILRRAVSAVKNREKGRAVILVMGDHGYRNEDYKRSEFAEFQGLAAVYFPDGDYRDLLPGTTHINVMRAAVSKTLGLPLPKLPDSLVRLGPNTEHPLIWW